MRFHVESFFLSSWGDCRCPFGLYELRPFIPHDFMIISLTFEADSVMTVDRSVFPAQTLFVRFVLTTFEFGIFPPSDIALLLCHPATHHPTPVPL
jgi:hypothetical protein